MWLQLLKPFRRLKQEDYKCQARLGYIARTCPSSMDTKGWERIDKEKQEIRKGREKRDYILFFLQYSFFSLLETIIYRHFLARTDVFVSFPGFSSTWLPGLSPGDLNFKRDTTHSHQKLTRFLETVFFSRPHRCESF